MALAVRIGYIAEAEGHHPDLHVHWGRLVIDLTTHAAKGLTRNDFVLAAKIDHILNR
jgi:4a-hydroxytetrahydrobiopterin dehydratase